MNRNPTQSRHLFHIWQYYYITLPPPTQQNFYFVAFAQARIKRDRRNKIIVLLAFAWLNVARYTWNKNPQSFKTLQRPPPRHSEERSDEESFLFRYCKDPSLTLRITCKGTLLSHWFILLPLLSFWGAKWRRIFPLSIPQGSFADAQDDMEGNQISELKHICLLGIQIYGTICVRTKSNIDTVTFAHFLVYITFSFLFRLIFSALRIFYLSPFDFAWKSDFRLSFLYRLCYNNIIILA